MTRYEQAAVTLLAFTVGSFIALTALHFMGAHLDAQFETEHLTAW